MASLLILSGLTTQAQPENEDWVPRKLATSLSPRFVTITKRLEIIGTALQKLPKLSGTDALGSHGFHSNFTKTLSDHWLELTWTSPQRFDSIALVPTRLMTENGDAGNYGFPVSFRIEATRFGSDKKFTLLEVRDTQLSLRRGEPLFLKVTAAGIRSLRLVPLKLVPLAGKNELFLSLAEWAVFANSKNIARNGIFSAKASTEGELGWGLRYLSDEQTVLGPPELATEGNSLGWHGDSDPLWAIIDLGTIHTFNAVRLIAAKGDGPTKGPGFGFPVQFHFETCSDLSLGDWKMVWQTGLRNIANPGYNPMTIPFNPANGRYLRFSIDKMHAPDDVTFPRLLLSELEVLQDGRNLAAYCSVTSSDRRKLIAHDGVRVWSAASLTDGYTSSGRIIPERLWLSQLSERFDLVSERVRLTQERSNLLRFWNRLAVASTITLLLIVAVTLAIWLNRVRRGNRKVLESLRLNISNDLHDEVGSNLATIALLSELKPSVENIHNINRLSRETSLALREIVEITLATDSNQKNVLERLREIASLMLSEHRWTFEVEEPGSFDLQQRKNIVFFFKESLHNIIRHADAKQVEIVFKKSPHHYHLEISDDGIGIQPAALQRPGLLRTLRQRAEKLYGNLEVDSRPGLGTRLSLSFPIAH